MISKHELRHGDRVWSSYSPYEGWYEYIESSSCGRRAIVTNKDYGMCSFGYEDLHLEESKQAKVDIAKPILEERKVGKVQMELFDEGFPNAILEVAKVMTWAGVHKGYKPHDWVNLPDAENSFPAAASRHRVKGLIQKVNGLAVNERTDEESNILHKAHEAFNVLAELELMLRGKIK